MTTQKNDIAAKNLLLPLAVMAFTMTLFFAFQTTQVMRDRSVLSQSLKQLEKPYDDAQKLNAQFGGLVVGTRKLAEEGNATAKMLEGQLKKIGVIQPEAEAQVAPVPAAQDKGAQGPVKP